MSAEDISHPTRQIHQRRRTACLDVSVRAITTFSRLPAERELAIEVGVSHATARKAVQVLL